MATVYTHINQNKRATALIIVFFISFITFIGWVVGEVYYNGGFFLVGIALIISGLTSFYSYYNSDKIVLAISKAQEVSYEAQPELHSLVENLCIASGLPKPRIYVIADTALNAFATGRDPQHAVICFTTGILQTLDKRELEGVIAHELSHIGNYDIRLMSIVSILVGTITLLADLFTRGMMYGGRGRKSEAGGIIVLIGIVLLILSPIIAVLIKASVSRKREFLADSSAALTTRYPQGLANALKKLASDAEVLEAANGATAHMYIVHPLKGQSISKLFDTHPPVQERIQRLESM